MTQIKVMFYICSALAVVWKPEKAGLPMMFRSNFEGLRDSDRASLPIMNHRTQGRTTAGGDAKPRQTIFWSVGYFLERKFIQERISNVVFPIRLSHMVYTMRA